MCVGNLALYYRPTANVIVGDHYFRLFDIGGAIGIAGMVLMLVWSAVRHTIALYKAERLP